MHSLIFGIHCKSFLGMWSPSFPGFWVCFFFVFSGVSYQCLMSWWYRLMLHTYQILWFCVSNGGSTANRLKQTLWCWCWGTGPASSTGWADWFPSFQRTSSLLLLLPLSFQRYCHFITSSVTFLVFVIRSTFFSPVTSLSPCSGKLLFWSNTDTNL